jgi:DNA-binding NarL/FixJ family response regulator
MRGTAVSIREPEQGVSQRRLTVVNVEDQRELREGLAQLIDSAPDFRCIGRFATMEAALSAISELLPDLALVDIGLPGMSGIEGIRLIHERHPQILLLVLSVYDDDDRIFEALCAGACGYLLKKTPPDRLIQSLREAVAGGSPMTPEIARRVVELFREFRPPQKADYELTPHELRLLKLLVDGHTYQSAAAVFGVTVHAITFHMRRIFEKLQVHSKSAAVAKALKAGLI